MNKLRNLEIGKEIELSQPQKEGKISVEEAIFRRRSLRSFAEKSLSLEQVAQLLWSAQGITSPSEGYRAAPSAGATYSLEIYLVCKEGIFSYLPEKHRLKKIFTENRLNLLSEACLDQEWVRTSAIDIVISALFERITLRYRQRGIGYVYIEVGHCAENIHLQAISLGLVSVPVGAFDDDLVAQVLGLPKNIKPLYIIPIGYPPN